MKGDFTRLTFDPSLHYSGVLHQQGRIWLDADWNEDVASRLHLLRQTARDVIGTSGAPEPGTAFRIRPHTDPRNQADFRIDAGRYYVDGILCQLEHQTTYLDQPDLPSPEPVDLPAGSQAHYALIYLDVWERLISYLEDEALRETALGGPDTTTRLKTVAQVKVAAIPHVPDPPDCTNAAAFLPSLGSGKLSVVSADSYTGRANRLYRVEIHDRGEVMGGGRDAAFRIPLEQEAIKDTASLTLNRPPTAAQKAALLRSGTALLVDTKAGRTEAVSIAAINDKTVTLAAGLTETWEASGAELTNQARFKWSRDNAAFAVGVTFADKEAKDRSRFILSSLGRDQQTHLRAGDLVEICDDIGDLGLGHGHLTYLADDPDPDDFSVTIASPLPKRFHPPKENERGYRYLILRRWDGVGWADARVGDVEPADQHLGDGVRIRFDGEDLHAGDYWQFAARSATGRVDALTDRAPAGIRRHRTALAIARWQDEPWYDRDEIGQAMGAAAFDSDRAERMRRGMDAAAAGQHRLALSLIQAIALDAGATAEQIEGLERELGSMAGEHHVTMSVLHDCRKPFMPLDERSCDCTVTVAPGDSLKAALARIGPAGGTVCLLPGIHELTETITVAHKHGLTIRGAGATTVLTAHGTRIALLFEHCDDLSLRDFRASSGPPQASGTRAPSAATIDAGPLCGVLTFVDCRGLHVESCTVSCAPFGNGAAERACITVRGLDADLESRLKRLDLQPSALDALDLDDDDLDARQVAAAHLATSLPAAAQFYHSADASPSPRRFARHHRSHTSGFTLRDCRLYAGRGQNGLVVADCQGGTVEDNWLLPLPDLDSPGMTVDEVAAHRRGHRGMSVLDASLTTVTDNVTVGFGVATMVQGTDMTWHGNRAYRCGEGIVVSQSGSLRFHQNVIVADEGPAAVIVCERGEVILDGNYLEGKAGSRSSIACAEVIAASALLTSNRCRARAGDDRLLAVGVAAHTISYTANRSLCDGDSASLISNVVLHASRAGKVRGRGTIVAQGNTCFEEPAAAQAQRWPSRPEGRNRHGVIGLLIDVWEDVEDALEHLVGEPDEPRRISLLATGRAVICATNVVSHHVVPRGEGDKTYAHGNIRGIF